MDIRDSIALHRRWMRLLWQAALNPVKASSDRSLLKRFLLKRRVFDVVAILLQWKDSRRLLLQQANLSDTSPEGRAIAHNLTQVQKKLATTTRRVEPLYQIASQPYRDLSHERILMVGCRNIVEVLIAWLNGFRWKNITAIDLFSVTPKIQVMNAEHLTFGDESFDVVTIVNTIAYCPNPLKVLQGAVRVLKPGGRLVFNYMFTGNIHNTSEYAPVDIISSMGNRPAQEVHDAVRGFGMRLFHYETLEKADSTNFFGVVHFFGYIKQPPSSVDPLDP